MRFASLFLLSLFAIACGGKMRPGNERREAHFQLRREVNVVRAADHQPMSPASFWSELVRAQLIYVGETHDSVEHHLIQHEIIRRLHIRGSHIAIGMEMVQTPFQTALDKWTAGRLDEGALWRQTEFRDRWGFDPQLYITIFELGRSNEIPILALNAPAEWTRAVAQKGIKDVDGKIRNSLPDMDLTNKPHRQFVGDDLRAHHPKMSEQSFENYYQAQVLWDEQMAETLSHSITSRKLEQVVVLAGRKHVQRGAGIPRCAERRGLKNYRIVLPVTQEELENEFLKENDPNTYYWVYDPLDY